jgi:hypothetical protein
MTAEPPRKRWPWPLFLTGIFLLECATWFWMSDTDYSGSPKYATFGTSAEFIFGQIYFLLLPLSAGYSIIFCLIARRFSHVFAWAALLLISSVLIALSAYSALPSTRVRAVIGDEAWREARLESFHQWESHTYSPRNWLEGVISGPPDLPEIISKHCGLKKERIPFGSLIPFLPVDLLKKLNRQPLPDALEVYVRKSCPFPYLFYRYPENGKIYFHVLK